MMEQALQKSPAYNPMMYAAQELPQLPYESDANAYADPVLLSAQSYCGAAVPYMGLVNSSNNTGSTIIFGGQPGPMLGAHNSPPNTNNSSSGFCAGTGGSCSTPSSSHRNNALAQQQDTASPYASASIFNAQENGEEEFAGSRVPADFARSIPPPPQYPPPPVPRSGGSSNSDLVDDYAPERKSSHGSIERRKKRQSTPSSARHGKSSKEKKFLLGPGSSAELQLLNQQNRPLPAPDRSSGHDEATYDSQTSSGHHYTYYCDLNGNTAEPRAAYMLENHQSPVYLDSQAPLKPKSNGSSLSLFF
ncbi:hypothetical protein Ciccas_010409 [Cichlidogyrus casuarinus]|uniref:Uncharacterized protein n=1 Tax=Cichlidogyrus casuarinus TaxID=1844966 RepID=A0ABD2PVU9_9PLAT